MLAPRPGSLHVDGTVGGGGHTERILEAASPDGRVLGLDADPAAIARVGERLARFGDRLVLRQANFRDLATVAPEAGFPAVDGILLDLGLSSFQLADPARGFSFRADGRLDMRFDPGTGRPGCGAARGARRGGARRPLPALRRGAACAAHRARCRRGASSGPGHHGGSIRLARRTRRPAPSRPTRADPSRHPRLPGAPNRGQRRARCARGRPRRGGRAASPARPTGRAGLPLARGSTRQALRRGRAPRLHLPTQLSRLCLRPGPPSPPRRPPAGNAHGGGGRRESPRPERPAPDRGTARRMSRPGVDATEGSHR